MASDDQQKQAEELKRQTEEKVSQVLGAMMDKVQEGKDMAYGAATGAWDQTKKSTNQTGSFMSETAGGARDKAFDMGQATKDNVSQMGQTTMNKASEMAQATKDTAVSGKDQTCGTVQNTGVQAKSVADGVLAAVKKTFGMGEGQGDKGTA